MFKKLVFLCLFATAHLQAEILEISQIDEIRSYAQKDSLLLFDIDDTLINNPISLGSPPWRSWAKSKIPNNKADFVIYDALTLYLAKIATYKPVESTTVQLISDLQQEGNAVFAFTSRGRSQWYTTDIDGVDRFTSHQLNTVGINFKNTLIPQKLNVLESPYFLDGIIFAQHIKKGDLLKRLLNELNYRPSLIIFVDDKLDQVQSVEIALKELEIPFVGFWYNRSEIDWIKFNPNIANIQLEYILFSQTILNIEDVEEILNSKQPLDPQSYLKEILDQFDISQLVPDLSNY